MALFAGLSAFPLTPVDASGRVDADGVAQLTERLAMAGERPVPARTGFNLGIQRLHPGSMGPIWRAMIRRVFDQGALGDITAGALEGLRKGVSAHSTGRAQSGPVRQRRRPRRHHGRAPLGGSAYAACLITATSPPNRHHGRLISGLE